MGHPVPDLRQAVRVAQPNMSELHWSEFERHYWQARKGRDICADKHTSYIFVSLLVGVLLYNMGLLWRQQGTFMNQAVAVMFLHILGECCFSYCITKHVQLYIQHRSMFIMSVRMLFLVSMLYYVPRTWTYTVPLQLAANKQQTQTYRLLFAYTSSGLLETLALQLPMRAAVPYHTTRAALYGVVALPELVRVMTASPALADTAKQIWQDLSELYGSAMGVITGIEVPNFGHSTVPCSVLALVLFMHVAFGLLVPLYILGVMQSYSKRAYAARVQADMASSGGSTARMVQAAAPTAAPPAGQLANEQVPLLQGAGAINTSSASVQPRQEPRAATARAQSIDPCSSRSNNGGSTDRGDNHRLNSSSAAALGANGSVSERMTWRVSIQHAWQLICGAEFGCVAHAIILFCSTMLFWSLTEAFVTLGASSIQGSYLCA